MPYPIPSQLPTSFELKIGSLDVTSNVVSLRFKWPEISMGQPQTSTVEFSLKEKFPDDTPGKLNPDNDTQLCRQAHQCTLKVDGFLLFTGWLDRYKYSPQTQTASGTLIDAIELISYSRSEFELEDIEIGAGTGVGAAVKRLLEEAAKDYQGNQVISVAQPDLTGVFSAPVTSGDPVGDAQKYASADRVYMYATKTGAIAWKQYPSTGQPLFRKALSELITFEQDLTADSWLASQLTVRGSHEEAVPNEDAIETADFKNNVVTSTYKPYGTIRAEIGDPDALNAVMFPTEYERKEIKYTYGEVVQGKGEELLQTDTTTYRPYAVIRAEMGDPDALNAVMFLSPYQQITETRTKKTIFKPYGLIRAEMEDPDALNAVMFLSEYSAEEVTETEPWQKWSRYNSPPRENAPPPEFNVNTVPVSGTVTTSPTCTAPFLRRPMVKDVGYLYDGGQAQALAGWLILLQQQRDDSYLIEMPPPKEWLANPVPFVIFDAHDGRFIAEAPELVIDASDGRCVWIVRGLRIGLIDPVPNPPELIPYSPPSSALSVAPLPSFTFTQGFAIAPITAQAFGGTPPYTWSGSLPPGLSIDASTGIISGMPTAIGSSTYTYSVADSASNNASRNFDITVVALPVERPPIAIDQLALFKRKQRLLVRVVDVPSETVLFRRVRRLIASVVAGAAPPVNDEFANATDLGNVENVVVFSDHLTMLGATRQPDEPTHAPGSTRSLWYKFSTPIGNNVEITAQKQDPFSPREFFPNIFVYTGTAINALTPVSLTTPPAPIIPGEVTVAFTATVEDYYVAFTPDAADLYPSPTNPYRLGFVGDSTFAPTSPVAGYNLWHKNDAADIIDSGGAILQWSDSSGNAAHLLQATSADQPTRISAGLNGRDTLRFDGTSDRMALTFASGQAFTARTIYLVFKQISWANGDSILSLRLDGNVNTSRHLRQNSVSPIIAMDSALNNSDLAVGDWGILTVVIDGASSFSQINQLTAVTGTVSSLVFSVNDTLFLGSRTSPSAPANIEVAEILMYDVIHDLGDRQNTQAYLAAKHGISI